MVPDPTLAEAFLADPSYANHNAWFRACAEADLLQLDTKNGASLVATLGTIARGFAALDKAHWDPTHHAQASADGECLDCYAEWPCAVERARRAVRGLKLDFSAVEGNLDTSERCGKPLPHRIGLGLPDSFCRMVKDHPGDCGQKEEF